MMDVVFLDALLAALGQRYKAGPIEQEYVHLLYRHGKAEFHPSRMRVASGKTPTIELQVDIRVPPQFHREAAEKLRKLLEEKSLTGRGFERKTETLTGMSNTKGEEKGGVLSTYYLMEPLPVEQAAKNIRAIVESIDTPLVLGIHEARDVEARNPPPPSIKRRDPLEKWSYRIEGGLASSKTIIVDPNVRTLSVVTRSLLSKTSPITDLRLAGLETFDVAREGNRSRLVAVSREGERTPLIEFNSTQASLATCERMADKLRIPIRGL